MDFPFGFRMIILMPLYQQYLYITYAAAPGGEASYHVARSTRPGAIKNI